jgi:hypothetical protein
MVTAVQPAGTRDSPGEVNVERLGWKMTQAAEGAA